MKSCRALALIALSLLLSAQNSAASLSDVLKVYAPVPKHLRPSLDARLKLYVEYERTQQFEKLYELFSETYIAYLKTFSRGSKSEYVAFGKKLGKFRMGVVHFTPTSVTKRSDDVYVIFGTIKSRGGKGFFEDKGSIEARWKNGDWYFSELGVEVED